MELIFLLLIALSVSEACLESEIPSWTDGDEQISTRKEIASSGSFPIADSQQKLMIFYSG